MKSEWRKVLLLGALVPVVATWLILWNEPEPASTAPRSSGAQASSSRKAPAVDESSLEPVPPVSAAPDEDSPPSEREPFEQPESEELFWEELERLEGEDKQQALDYALAGEKWYDDEGRPAEARRAKIVTLLVDVGNMKEARVRTRAFIEKYPQSSYRRLVQGVTGIHPRPGAPPH